MLIDIANASVRDGHRVSVCITRNTTTLVPELVSGIDVVVLDRKRALSPSAIARLVRWIRREQPDVLHVHMRSSMAFIVVLKALYAIRRPVVFHDHYGTIELDTAVPRWFQLGHHLIDHYVGVYEKLCDWARAAGVSPARTTTIPNAIDLARIQRVSQSTIRTELEISDERPLGVLVATIRRDKGIETLVDAVGRMRLREEVDIVVAGGLADPVYVAEIRAELLRLGLDKTFTLLGARDDVPQILAGATFGILSSHTESGPLVLIEYLVARLPIVATRVGDVGKRLADLGVVGFAKPRDATDLAQRLDELMELSRPALLERAENGHRVVTAEWDIRSAMPRWYEVYRTAIRKLS